MYPVGWEGVNKVLIFSDSFLEGLCYVSMSQKFVDGFDREEAQNSDVAEVFNLNYTSRDPVFVTDGLIVVLYQ